MIVYRMPCITLVSDSCMENKFYVKAVVELHFNAILPLPFAAASRSPDKLFHRLRIFNRYRNLSWPKPGLKSRMNEADTCRQRATRLAFRCKTD
jgi:hypothetical protein